MDRHMEMEGKDADEGHCRFFSLGVLCAFLRRLGNHFTN